MEISRIVYTLYIEILATRTKKTVSGMKKSESERWIRCRRDG